MDLNFVWNVNSTTRRNLCMRKVHCAALVRSHTKILMLMVMISSATLYQIQIKINTMSLFCGRYTTLCNQHCSQHFPVEWDRPVFYRSLSVTSRNYCELNATVTPFLFLLSTTAHDQWTRNRSVTFLLYLDVEMFYNCLVLHELDLILLLETTTKCLRLFEC